MKAKNVGGREASIKNARNTCIVMGEEERTVIDARKGDQSISEFVRDSIRIRGDSSDNLLIREVQELKEENLQIRHELDTYRQKEATQTKIRHELDTYRQKEATQTKIQTETLADLGAAYAHYLEQTNPTEHYRNNWIDGRCKIAGILPIEFLAYVENYRVIQK
jgi:hypothetical protein